MLSEQLGHHGVVQMMVSGVLVAGRHAVTAQDSTVHGLGGVDDGGQSTLGVNTVDIGVVQQALGLQHVDISHAGQVGILLDTFLDAQSLELSGLIGGDVAADLTDKGGGTQAGQTNSTLVLMLVVLIAVLGLSNNNQVVQLAEGSVLGAGAGHVDDTLLEADDLTGSDDGHAAQDMGLTGTDGINLGDDAGEHTAGAFDLHAGLNDVLDGSDAHALAGLGDVELEVRNPILHVVLFIHEGLDGIGIDVKGAVFYFAFL